MASDDDVYRYTEAGMQYIIQWHSKNKSGSPRLVLQTPKTTKPIPTGNTMH